MSKFTCLECYHNFDETDGNLVDNQGYLEFTCTDCSRKQVCGACGEFESFSNHNCSEEVNA